jgi:enoyl-CoA hydratase/carnithine racemase
LGSEPVSGSSATFGVLSEDHGRVRLLTLARPEKLNAFTAHGYRNLRSRLEEAATEPDVAVCVLTGQGRAFSAGVDLGEMGRPGGSAELGADFDPLLECLAHFPKPLMAAVNGLAVGFGATLLLHCDIVVLDEEAELRLPFATLGTAAEAGSSFLLPERVGSQQAAWMMLSASPLSAADAVANGFAIARVEGGRVLDVTLEMAQKMAVHGAAVLMANKTLLREGDPARIGDAWKREKATMLALAEEFGSFGWPDQR